VSARPPRDLEEIALHLLYPIIIQNSVNCPLLAKPNPKFDDRFSSESERLNALLPYS
jgi:hypothetical protein